MRRGSAANQINEGSKVPAIYFGWRSWGWEEEEEGESAEICCERRFPSRGACRAASLLPPREAGFL